MLTLNLITSIPFSVTYSASIPLPPDYQKMYSAVTPCSRLSRAPSRLQGPCRAILTTGRPATAAPPRVADYEAAMKPINVAVEDPESLRSTWAHRSWVAAGSAAVLTSLAECAAAAANSSSVIEPLLGAYLGYLLADLGSGIFHWAVDNYGSASTPVFGSQIEAFQGHHRWPRTITRREFANNLHGLARAVAIAVAPVKMVIAASGGGAAVHAFVGAFAGCVMLSQQFHAWAHEGRGRLPAAVDALQQAGVLVSRRAHAVHHRAPYSTNYCIVSGAWNEVLDEYKVFEAAEMAIFFRFGVRPRSWNELRPEWREEEEEEDKAEATATS